MYDIGAFLSLIYFRSFCLSSLDNKSRMARISLLGRVLGMLCLSTRPNQCLGKCFPFQNKFNSLSTTFSRELANITSW